MKLRLEWWGLGTEEGSVTLQPQAAALTLITNNIQYF